MNTPSTATMSSIPRSPPGMVTFRYQHHLGSELAYVPLAATHEEAQEIAAHAFPTLLDGVDPRWLFFTMAVRYQSTGERKEIEISPNAWFYVTSKLTPYRLIDVHVVPSSGSPPGSASKSYAVLYDDASPAPKQQAAPPYPVEFPSPAAHAHVPPYPDSPPPSYPGSLLPEKKHLHPHLQPHPHPHPRMSPANYGYGYGYNYNYDHDHDYDYGYGYDYGRGDYGYATDDDATRRRRRGRGYADLPATASRDYDPYFSDGHPGIDRRSAGWSSSVQLESGRRWGGRALLSSIRQRIFPITWDEPSRRSRRRRHPTVQFATFEHENENPYESTSKSGRSYVPSLI